MWAIDKEWMQQNQCKIIDTELRLPGKRVEKNWVWKWYGEEYCYYVGVCILKTFI